MLLPLHVGLDVDTVLSAGPLHLPELWAEAVRSSAISFCSGVLWGKSTQFWLHVLTSEWFMDSSFHCEASFLVQDGKGRWCWCCT